MVYEFWWPMQGISWRPHLLVPGESLAELLAGGLAGEGAFLASCWAGLCLGRTFEMEDS